MKKELIGIFVCMLFVGVSVSSAFAADTKQSIVNKASEEECWDCKEVNDRQLVVLEKQLNRIEVYTKLLLVLSRDNPEIKEKCEEILDVINSNRQWEFPIMCLIFGLIYFPLEFIISSADYIISLLERNPIIQDIIFTILFISGLAPLYMFVVTYGEIWKCDWAPNQ